MFRWGEGVHGPSMCLDGEREYMDHQCVEMGRGSTWTINVFA